MNIPEYEHFAVVYEEPIWAEREGLGGSHPEETRQVYQPFPNKQALETWLEDSGKSLKHTVIKSRPLEVVRTMTVSYDFS